MKIKPLSDNVVVKMTEAEEGGPRMMGQSKTASKRQD